MTLSELLRYQLYENPDEKVMMKSEIKHIENYIELQKMRQTDLNIDYQKVGVMEGVMVYPFVTILFFFCFSASFLKSLSPLNPTLA